MKQKQNHQNKLTHKDDHNPFDEMWFWLRLASLPIEFIVSGHGSSPYTLEKPKANTSV